MIAELLLDRGADVDRANKQGDTPLHYTCDIEMNADRNVQGRLEVAELLLDRGTEVDRANNNGMTPLRNACIHGHLEVAKLLLDRGAAGDRESDIGSTPLHRVCVQGHLEVAKLLLDWGAEVDGAEDDERTPLYLACTQGHLEVIKLLLEHAASPDTTEQPEFKDPTKALLRQWSDATRASATAGSTSRCPSFRWKPGHHADFPVAFHQQVGATFWPLAALMVGDEGPLSCLKGGLRGQG